MTTTTTGSNSSSSSSSCRSLTYLRPEVAALKERLDLFVKEECIPAEKEYEAHLRDRHGTDRWTSDAVPPCLERLKNRAKELGFWNLFLPPRLIRKIPPGLLQQSREQQEQQLLPSIALTYREYGILCESLGRCPHVAPEACNTSAPDTGNMEVLIEFGTPQQQREYLVPLLRGEIRSCFLMTEPDVASSDPTNLQTKLTKTIRQSSSSNGGTAKVEYILNGRKWWSTGAMDPRCRMALVVARMDYGSSSGHENNNDDESSDNNKHGAHTIVLVPMPQPGVILERALRVFGYDDAPSGHAQVALHQIKLDESNLIAGEGSGFRVSQARLGPGRIHHCMRAIGMASRSLELMLQRAMERQTFGKYLWEHGACQELLADAVADLQAARLLTLECAAALDEVGPRMARDQVALIKYAVPTLTHRVVDRAIQLFGGAGLSDEDHVLGRFLCGLRSLRIADGPDAVHKRTMALLTLKKQFLLQQQQQQSHPPQSRL